MKVRRVFAIAVALALALVPAAASASTSWQIVATPNPGGTGALSFNVLKAVSCTSASNCTAVGVYGGLTTSAGQTLAEHWDGASWSVQATANLGNLYNELDGVKCVSATACTAVGFSEDFNTSTEATLAESWNGTSWSTRQTPDPAGAAVSQLNAVACTTTSNCMAVGSYSISNNPRTNLPLAERWNGSSWALQSVPAISNGQLLGISCTTASACTAVGYAGSDALSTNALVFRWNGISWKAQTVAKPSGSLSTRLNGVKCTSGTVCTAAGLAFYPQGTFNFSPEKTLAERWNGTAWKVQATPNPSQSSPPLDYLTAVSCTSSSSCTAVGAGENGFPVSTIAEHWDGISWKVQPTPNAANGADSRLLGVSCTTNCTAAGEADFDGGSAPEFTLAMHN